MSILICALENRVTKVQITNMNEQAVPKSNKAFVEMLFSNKLPLKNYPERVASDFVLHEPGILPFGGTYFGLAEYETLAVPKIQDYYDFNRFEFIGVYAEGNVVFGLLKIGIKNSEKSLSLCEQFTFDGNKVKEIKVFIM